MTRPAPSTALLAAALAAVGALAWWFAFFAEERVDPSSLHALPQRMGAFRGEEIPLSEGVESMLHASAHVQRVYRPASDGAAEPVWVYVGYYGGDRGGAPEHTPRSCYAAHGWRLGEVRTVAVEPARGLSVNEMWVRKGEGRRLVHYWYRSGERTGILGRLGVTLHRLERRLRGGPGDGALVRVSTPESAGGLAPTRARLVAFGSRLDRALDAAWPRGPSERAGAAR